MVNQFLEIWFQNLDSWLMFYIRCPDIEHKTALIEATKEMMMGFLDAIESIETEPLNNMELGEEKQSS